MVITGDPPKAAGGIGAARMMRHGDSRRKGRLRGKAAGLSSELCAGPIRWLPSLDRLIQAHDRHSIGRCPRLSVLLLDLRRRLGAPGERVIEVRQQAADQLAGGRLRRQAFRIRLRARHAFTIPLTLRRTAAASYSR